MKTTWCKSVVLIGATVAMVSGVFVMAQEGGANPGGPEPGKHPKHPLELALDANGDGTIDAAEIAGASVALRKLDKNGDGKLTADEYRPPRPPRPEGGGPGGPGR